MAFTLAGQGVSGVFGLTTTVTRATGSGKLLIAMVLHQSKSTVAITDSAGNSWQLGATTATTAATSEKLVSIYYVLAAAATTSVTATTTGANQPLYMNVSEWNGTGVALRSADSLLYASGAHTLAVPALTNDLIVAMIGYFSSGSVRTDTLSAPYTRLTDYGSTGTTWESYAYNIATSDGTQGPTWTGASLGSTGHVTLAFYELAAVGLASITDSSGWTILAGTTILANLSDSDPATGVTSPNNPTAALLKTTMPAISPPSGDFLVPVEGYRAGGASSGTVKAYLYEGATLRATSDTKSLGTANGAVTLTFLAANLTAVTSSAWGSGLNLWFEVAAA